MKVVHVGTEIHAVLGVMDDNGNIIQRAPLKVEVNLLHPAHYAKAAEAILQQKAKMEDDLKAQLAAAAPPPTDKKKEKQKPSQAAGEKPTQS